MRPTRSQVLTFRFGYIEQLMDLSGVDKHVSFSFLIISTKVVPFSYESLKMYLPLLSSLLTLFLIESKMKLLFLSFKSIKVKSFELYLVSLLE